MNETQALAGKKIAFIGAGNMAEAMIRGGLKAKDGNAEEGENAREEETGPHDGRAS